MLQILGAFCVRLSHRYIPNPLIFAFLLSVVIYVLGITMTGTGPFKMIEYWYGGFWNLLTFGMQMIALLLFGYVLACSPPVRAIVCWAARFPRSSGQAIILITVLAMAFAYVNWGLGLIVGAIAAREICAQAKLRGIRVHYPLAAAAGFSSLMVFAGGFSASAPLVMNSPNHFLFDKYGLVPIAETILTPYNLIIIGSWMLIMPFVYRAMQPPANQVEEIPDSIVADTPQAFGAKSVNESGASAQASYRIADNADERIRDDGIGVSSSGAAVASFGGDLSGSGQAAPSARSLAEKLEHASWLTWLMGAAGLSYIIFHFATRGFDLNLNIVNFTLLVTGLIAYRTPIAYVHAIDDGIKSCGQIALQFPFYAGIMGMMSGSGMITIFSDWLVSISNAYTFPMIAMISAAIVNLFVPSAGGQWAIQGPTLLEAARTLGVDFGVTIMAFTYGDQLTNGIQPFWMLPLLGVTFLKAREILGYTAVIMIVAFFIYAIGLTVLPPLFL
jgi:short-chain fatty acids transporter